MIENITQTRPTRAVLVGLNTGISSSDFDRSMDELKELVKAIDIEAALTVTQSLPSPDRSTYIGSGKVEEIAASLDMFDIDLVVVDGALSPMQARNLEKALDTEVIDRTGLILQIFARRAKTREACLQVEYAQLQYMLPRLAHMRTSLSRQGGGSGRLSNKGSGEKQLELDRRRIEHRMAELRRDLEGIRKERDTQRGRRMRSGLPEVALVGYTNAGKSTILNGLIDLYGVSGSEDKQVFEKDMLFATLDTSVRKIEPKDHRPFLLTDTVGFISDLPHDLVKAFRSTIEEAKFADLLLEVIDFSDPEYRHHMEVTQQTLKEIGAGEIPVIYVFNKSDILKDEQIESGSLPIEFPRTGADRVYISAKDKHSLDALIEVIDKKFAEEETEVTLLLPYKEGAILGELNSRGVVKMTEYQEDGVLVKALLTGKDISRFEAYMK
ncbi:GTPase HflX [Butyrivibrio sp. XPD2006]|uniref:GTPase HflX n=1 Tax=Butyrivibrio sp. XPD2006 TaxID=1280668 RepID=UPI0003B4122A|nr:GTPase HflX [Butyrivibrio sp. XPD2006]